MPSKGISFLPLGWVFKRSSVFDILCNQYSMNKCEKLSTPSNACSRSLRRISFDMLSLFRTSSPEASVSTKPMGFKIMSLIYSSVPLLPCTLSLESNLIFHHEDTSPATGPPRWSRSQFFTFYHAIWEGSQPCTRNTRSVASLCAWSQHPSNTPSSPSSYSKLP